MNTIQVEKPLITQRMARQEIKSLTGLRGIAAFWVILLHYIQLPATNYAFVKLNLFFRYGNEAVDIFFLLSAVVMCMAYEQQFSVSISGKDYRSFMIKRVFRLYPVYIFWMFAFLIIVRKFDFVTLSANLLLIQNLFDYKKYVIAGVFWSLSSEWMMYFIFPVLIYLFKRINSNTILLIVMLISLALCTMVPQFNNYYFSIHGIQKYQHLKLFTIVGTSSVLRCFFCYLMGISGYLLIQRSNVRKVISMLPHSNIVFSFVILLSFFLEMRAAIIFLSLIIILQLCLNENGSIFKQKVIYFLGKISYSTYLCHVFIISMMSIVLKKFMGELIMIKYQPLVIILAFILVMPISYISYLLFEQKATNWLKAKFLTKKATATSQST